MQLRFETPLAGEQYVAHRAWRTASLPCCPLHPQGGCSFARHGSYVRVNPTGARIARWYCPQGRRTFSLLPDFLASRLPCSLDSIEQIVLEVERSRSVEAAADALRTDEITLPGAIRWTRRRVTLVHGALAFALRAFPDSLGGCQASLSSLRAHLKADHVLLRLREIAGPCLCDLPPPLGFALPGGKRGRRIQHNKGPDPP